jgi:hypothetical protein
MPDRHCERSEAIQGDVARAALDCFAALAMTEESSLRLTRRKFVHFCSASRLAERQARRSRPVTTHDLAKVVVLTSSAG